MTLDLLDLDREATIVAVGGAGAFRVRLLEMGLVPGTPIRRAGQAPLGDPLAFKVRGAVITLRRADAATVTVAP